MSSNLIDTLTQLTGPSREVDCFERYTGPCPYNPFPANSLWGKAINDAWLSRLFRAKEARSDARD